MGFIRNISSPPPPPNMNEKYFLDHLSRIIDYYSRKYDRIVVMGDFNLEPSGAPIESLCDCYNLYNLVKVKTCFKGPPKCYTLYNLVKVKTCFKGPPKCYDLILTNCKYRFQNRQWLLDSQISIK